jgi:hypothetical protein
MAHFSASAYHHRRNDAQISRHPRALLRIPRATPTQRSATSFGANRCKRVHRSRRESSVKLAVTPVRKLNAHLWDREPHEHYVEEQWCSRRLFEVEPIEGRPRFAPVWIVWRRSGKSFRWRRFWAGCSMLIF